MPPIVSIVGKSESGKTTLIEKLIPELKNRGYRIGVVKHAHRGFDMDRQGKDSYRHKQAGADTVMTAAPGKIAIIKDNTDDRLGHLISYFEDVDLLITEGFKKENAPKIEVFRPERHQRPACMEEDKLVAIVSDTPLETHVPQFKAGDIVGVANFIVEKYLPTVQD